MLGNTNNNNKEQPLAAGRRAHNTCTSSRILALFLLKLVLWVGARLGRRRGGFLSQGSELGKRTSLVWSHQIGDFLVTCVTQMVG